jgi:hypothetical protein
MPFPIIREGDAPPPSGEPQPGRPQDRTLDGRDLTFETLEHGGAEPDTMPNAIRITDREGRSAVYVLKGEDKMETTTAMLTESKSRLADTEQVKHTPGPWKVFMTTDGRKFLGIGEVNGNGITDSGFGIWNWDEPEALANVHLMAAAPDMLAALKQTLAVVENIAASDEHYEIASAGRAAIAKAEGRAP